MTKAVEQIRRLGFEKHPAITLLFFIWLLIWFQGMASRDLWVLDEVRYAEAVRQMHVTGNIFTPHLNGEIYSDKPPLYFWYLALFMWGPLFGSALLALLCALGVHWIGTLIRGKFIGGLGAIVTASTLLFIGISQVVRMDLLMLFFMLMAIFFFCKGYKTQRRGFYYLIYVFLALSALTKGPLGLVIILPAIFLFLISKGDTREIIQLRLLRGFGIIIAIVGGWVLLTIWESGTAYVQEVFWRQLVGRARKSWIHQQPYYYYLLWLPLTFFPWIAYLPRALKRAWNDREGFGRLFVWWAIVAEVILSAISYKIFIYNLLYLPALGLIVGIMLEETISSKKWKSLKIETFITAILLFIAGIIFILGFILASKGFVNTHGFKVTGWLTTINIVIAVFVLIGASVGLLISLRRDKASISILLLVFLMIVLPKIMTGLVYTQLDEIMSPKRLCERIKWYDEQGFSGGQYKIELGRLNYYAQTDLKRLFTIEEVEEFLEKNPRAIVAITANHLAMNRDRLETVNVYENAFIGGTSPERTYHLLVQDGTHLKSLVEAMKKYRSEGFALARYKNDITLFDGYLGEKLTKINVKRDIKPFVEEHPKAAMVSSEYWLNQNAPQLKDWVVKEKAFFAGRYYCLLVYGEEE